MGHYNSLLDLGVCVCMPENSRGREGPGRCDCFPGMERFQPGSTTLPPVCPALSCLAPDPSLLPLTCLTSALLGQRLDVTSRKTLAQQEHPGTWRRFAGRVLIAKNPIRKWRCWSRGEGGEEHPSSCRGWGGASGRFQSRNVQHQGRCQSWCW